MIAVVLVVAVLYVAIHSNLPEEVFFRWFGLAVATAITFGYPLAWYRRYWHDSRFWISWAAMLALHLLIYVAVLLRVIAFRISLVCNCNAAGMVGDLSPSSNSRKADLAR